MISDFDLAKRLFPKARQLAQDAGLTASRTTQVRGWATADSEDGSVTVVLDTDAAGTDAEITVPTTGGITEGSEVRVTLVDGAPVGCSQVGSIDVAQGLARAAQAVADAINQFFWTDSNGAHVTQVPQDEWDNPEGASYHSGPNALWNALGMLFRDGLNNLLALTGGTTPGVSIYDGTGNTDSHIIASFIGNFIDLGRNSTNAVIRLCNGKGQIDYGKDPYETGSPQQLVIKGPHTEYDFVRGYTEYGIDENDNPFINIIAAGDTGYGPEIMLLHSEDATQHGYVGYGIELYADALSFSDFFYNARTFGISQVIGALDMYEAPHSDYTVTNLHVQGVINTAKTAVQMTIPVPYQLANITTVTLSGTYKVRQDGTFLFGSTESSAANLNNRYTAVPKYGGYVNVDISTGSTQSAATAGRVVDVLFPEITFSFS